MANKTISQLDQLLGLPDSSDFLAITDTSANFTKKITVDDLMSYVSIPEAGGGLDSAGVITVLNNASVGEFYDTSITSTSVVIGNNAANIDVRTNNPPNGSVVVGGRAGESLTTGYANILIGVEAGDAITTGIENVLIGPYALDNGLDEYNMTNIQRTTGIGTQVLQYTTGNFNTAVGYYAGRGNGISRNSVFIGHQAAIDQPATTGGINNIVIGNNAVKSSDDVSNEITFGDENISRFRIPGLGLDTNDATDGQSLTWDSVTGSFAWATITGGSGGIDSAAVTALIDSDYVALRAPAGGSSNIIDSGNDIIIVGSATINSDLTVTGSINNVTIGDGDLQDSAINNVGYGIDIFGSLTTGSNNIVFGYNSGTTLTSGNNNVVIGINADTTTETTSNEIVIGNDSNNRLRIPGLGLDTDSATDGQSLTWDSATGSFAWATITGGAGGIDSAAVTALIDSDYVQARQTTTGGGLTSTTTVTTSAIPVPIYTFSALTYNTAKVIVSVTDNINTQATEMLITHDGVAAIAVEYASLNTGSILGEFDVDINGTDVRLLTTSTTLDSCVYTVVPILL